MLKDFKQMVVELQAENSSSSKKEILKKYPQCKDLLRWVLDPYKKFNITSAKCKKHQHLKNSSSEYDDIIALLSDLTSGLLTGHSAIKAVNSFIKATQGYEDIIYRIIDKDLGARTGVSIINSVYPGLVPIFSVALAKDYFNESGIDLASESWYWSRKLDGVRCICIKKGCTVNFFSREGREFFTLSSVKEDVLNLPFENIVLDGEICIVDENENEDFQSVMKEIRKKNHIIRNPKYIIFDYLTQEEFEYQTSTRTLIERRNEARSVLSTRAYGLKRLDFGLEQNRITSEAELLKILDMAEKNGWEGLILRKDALYKGKRSKDILKVKKMMSIELEISGITVGLIDDGRGNKVEGMTAVKAIYKGNVVGIGSGWTFEERIMYKDNPNSIIGNDILVQFFEETKNQNGFYSLRFPVKKFVYDGKRRC